MLTRMKSRSFWIPLVSLLLICALLLLLLPPSTTEGEVLNLWDVGPITLDPAISSEVTSHSYIMQIFSGLVSLNDNMEIIPDLAESWEESQDGKTYIFHLRRGAKFHDGSEVKASDFKYSWQRACDPATGSRSAVEYLGDIVGARDMLSGETEEISGIRVIDDNTLEVTIQEPRAYFLYKLSYPTAFVVDETNVKDDEDWFYHSNGTGPFKLKEWTEGNALILERNDLYYGTKARLKQVFFHLMSGMPMALYEKGEIDVVAVSSAYIDQIRDENSPFHQQLQVFPALSMDYVGFNTTTPPFDDINVRRAFCHSVDRERIVELTLGNMVQPAQGILPPGMPGYNENLEGLEYDVEKAKEYIAASRYGDASNLPPLTITVAGEGGYISDYLGAIIQSWRDNLGVEVSVRQLQRENFLYSLKQEKDEMFMLGWVADYPDPHNFLSNLFYSGAENNVFEYSNPLLDSLIERASVEQDRPTRLSMYQEAEQIVVDEAPCMPLCFGQNYILTKPYVRDYQLNPLGIADLSKVYIEKDLI